MTTGLLSMLCAGLALATPPEEEEAPLVAPAAAAPAVEFDFSAAEISGAMRAPMRMKAGYGATPGGAQDVAYFRDRVKAGEVPPPEVFTAEGLLSEHDLPLVGAGCERLMCTTTRGVAVSLPAQPEVSHLVQIGFDSGLTGETFRRSPLNLVMVIDKSGSMTEELPLVQEGLRRVLDQLGPEDQLSIVLYGSEAHVLLPPTPVGQRAAITAAIARIAPDGATALEAGLALGYEVARASRRSFDGTTRVMLFTDEQPNVGRTDAASFGAMARAASQDGIGTTTFGVGVDFGAELAQQVSAVRGGNLFFFRDAERMVQTLRDDFDTMVTELAHDLELEVTPAPGHRIAGLYGLPGDAVTWTEGGGIRLTVETVFLSRSRGGLYVGVAPDGTSGGDGALATVNLAYSARDGGRERQSSVARVVDRPGAGDEGLTRGAALVDTFTTLRDAAGRAAAGDDGGALERVSALRSRLERARDPALEPERDLVATLEGNLARRLGRPAPTDPVSRRDPVSGLPVR